VLNQDDIDNLFNYNICVEDKIIYLGAGSIDDGDGNEADIITEKTCQKFIKGLIVLDRKDKHKPITIILNSPGGYTEYGFAIYDAIKNCQSPTIVDVYGQAYSIASIILQAGTVRRASRNSTIMVHYGTLQTPEQNTKSSERVIEQCKKHEVIMEKIYLDKIKEKKVKFSLNKLKKRLAFDWFMSPKEALEFNLIDEII